MSIAVIADEDTVLGFKLAGIKKSLIFEGTKIDSLIEKVNDSQILIVTESVGAFLREENLHKSIKPVMVEIPDKEGSKGTAMDNIAALFEQAVGVKLKK